MLDYLSVGFVLKPQGLKGEIKVKPLTDEPERFDTLTHIYLKEEDKYKRIIVEARRYDKSFVYLKLAGYTSIEAVEPLRNAYLWIPRSLARLLPKDAYFIADILGCMVETKEGRILGELVDLIHTGSNDVYVIKGKKGDILVPALKRHVLSVDPPKKRIVVDLTGLEELLSDAD